MSFLYVPHLAKNAKARRKALISTQNHLPIVDLVNI